MVIYTLPGGIEMLHKLSGTSFIARLHQVNGMRTGKRDKQGRFPLPVTALASDTTASVLPLRGELSCRRLLSNVFLSGMS